MNLELCIIGVAIALICSYTGKYAREEMYYNENCNRKNMDMLYLVSLFVGLFGLGLMIASINM